LIGALAVTTGAAAWLSGNARNRTRRHSAHTVDTISCYEKI